MSVIRACVFDAYGTLFDVHSASRRVAPRVPGVWELSELWRAKQLEYTWLRALMGRYVDFWQVVRDALDYAMAAQAVSDDALREELLRLFQRVEPYPEVKNVLDVLRRRGLKTAILSNGSPTMLTHAVVGAGLEEGLDAVLSVDSLRTFKPDPRVYQLAAGALGLPLSEMAFVTANAWDAHGAACAGFQVYWLNRAGAPRERIAGEVRGELETLSALPAQLH